MHAPFNQKIVVSVVDDVTLDSSFSPAFTVKGGAKINKNILIGGSAFILDGNTHVDCVEGKIQHFDKTISNVVIAQRITENTIGQGIVITGNVVLNDGDFCGNLFGNVVMKHNANVYNNFTVSGNTYLKGSLVLLKDAAFDGNIQVDKSITVKSINLDSVNLNGAIKYLMDEVKKLAGDVSNIKKQIISLKSTKFLTQLNHNHTF